jgi:hypothetical protein
MPRSTAIPARRGRDSKTAYERRYAKATATPPPFGTGLSCSLWATSGRSTNPQRRNIFRTKGVRKSARRKDARPRKIREYMAI